MIKKQVDIEKSFNFHNDDCIVVACSTGPDSMALMDLLLNIREKYNLKLICAHVNHNLRIESEKEATFMKTYCDEHDIVFEYLKIEEYGDDNFHNEAHNIRYAFFEELVNKYKANYLMTAHHGDDLMETILMRITRGSNLAGYSGFKKTVDMNNYKIVRPLIEYTKEDLEEYDKKHHVNYFIDSTNAKMKYTRNRYRKNVLPFLKSEDKDVHLKFLKFSENLNEALKYIDKERDKQLKVIFNKDKLIVSKFNELDIYMQKEILYYLMHDYYQDDLLLINDKHVDLLLSLINGRKKNTYVNLPNEVKAIRNYDEVYLTKDTLQLDQYEIEFNDYVELPNGKTITLAEDVGNSNSICRLNSKEIKLPLIVRTRKIGDRLTIKGLNVSKKIKDVFIENKVNALDRDLWPVVTDSCGEIVWLPGLKKSKFDKKKDEIYDIIMKYN